MHDSTADYCELDGGTVGRLDGLNEQIRGLPHFERTDLRFPAKGACPFYCKRTQRARSCQPRGFRFGPQIEIADAHHRIGADAERHAGFAEQLERHAAMAMRAVGSRTMGDCSAGLAQQLHIRRTHLDAVNAESAPLQHAKTREIAERAHHRAGASGLRNARDPPGPAIAYARDCCFVERLRARALFQLADAPDPLEEFRFPVLRATTQMRQLEVGVAVDETREELSIWEVERLRAQRPGYLDVWCGRRRRGS